MTPKPRRVYFPSDEGDDMPQAEPSVKLEVVKYIVTAVVAAMGSAGATYYGIQERLKVLEIRQEYGNQRMDQMLQELREMKGDIKTLAIASLAQQRARGR